MSFQAPCLNIEVKVTKRSIRSKEFLTLIKRNFGYTWHINKVIYSFNWLDFSTFQTVILFILWSPKNISPMSKDVSLTFKDISYFVSHSIDTCPCCLLLIQWDRMSYTIIIIGLLSGWNRAAKTETERGDWGQSYSWGKSSWGIIKP